MDSIDMLLRAADCDSQDNRSLITRSRSRSNSIQSEIPTTPKRLKIATSLDFECKKCHTHFSSFSFLTMHTKAVHHEPTIPSPRSQPLKAYPPKFRLNVDHLTEEEKSRCCLSCGVLFAKRKNYYRHEREIHLQIKKFVCSIEGCERTFKRSEHLYRHQDANHPVSKKPCIDDFNQLCIPS